MADFSSLFMTNIPLCVYMYIIYMYCVRMCVCVYLTSLFVYHLGIFHALAIINNAIQTLVCIYFFELVFLFSLCVYPGMESLDHMVLLFLVF